MVAYWFSMKKIENLLLLPFLFTLYGINRVSANLLSIHFHDSYFVTNPAGVCTWFLCYVIVLFVLYKVVRTRQQAVNTVWAAAHIAITFLLIVMVWWAFEYSDMPLNGFSLSKPDDFAAWAGYNRVLIASALIFSLVQVVFWIWFVVQMVRKPKPALQ
jgi:hypothetical protein